MARPPNTQVPGLQSQRGISSGPQGALLGRVAGKGPVQILQPAQLRALGIVTRGQVAGPAVPSGDVVANITSGPAQAIGNTLTAIFDFIFSAVRGSILYRGAASWLALGPGTAGQVLATGGPSADPSWETPGANPTATASDIAVNGTATTLMRSDAAPAVQKASASQFGLVKVDGTSITAAGGVISSSGGGGGGGALTLISEVDTAGSQPSVTFSSISGVYRDLIVRVRGAGDNASSTVQVLVQFNGDTAANYDRLDNEVSHASTAVGEVLAGTSITVGYLAAATAPANVGDGLEALIFNYRDTIFQKALKSQSTVKVANTTGNLLSVTTAGWWRSTAAINAVKVFLSAGNFVNGSVVSLYGSM